MECASRFQGKVTAELEEARRQHVPTFTHFLDIPILFVIVALGAMRPNSWTPFAIGIGLALVAAASLTFAIPRPSPFGRHMINEEDKL